MKLIHVTQINAHNFFSDIKNNLVFQLYGKDIDETHRPSKNPTYYPDEIVEEDKQNRDVFKVQKARDVISVENVANP